VAIACFSAAPARSTRDDVCAKQGKRGDQACYAVGEAATFQQAVEVQGRR
jgi:hypothetical protein